MGILDDILDAGKDVLSFGDKILKEFGSAATNLGRGVYRIAKDGAEFFVSNGEVIIDTFDDIHTAFSNLMRGAIGIRALRWNEIATVDKLFQNSVPYSKVVVVSMEGIGGKPFTVPAELFGSIYSYFSAPTALLNFLAASLRLNGKYLIFMGDAGYRDALNYYADRGRFDAATNTRGRVTGQYLCHELTHVWQGEHQDKYSFQYVLNSFGHQIGAKVTGGSAYTHTVGGHWRDYEIEQQGSIVDNFWKDTGNMNQVPIEKNTSWPYIKDVIRAKNPNANYAYTYREYIPAKPTVVKKLTAAEADGLRKQAYAFRVQGEALVRTGLPAMVAQGQQMINAATQIEATLRAQGFPVNLISMPGGSGVSTLNMPAAPGTRATMPGAGGVKPPPILKK